MVNSKRCGDSVMNCNFGNCQFENKAHPTFSWLITNIMTTYKCSLIKRSLVARGIGDRILNTDCKGSSLYCKLPSSVIVWNKTNIADNPYRLVTKIDDGVYKRNYQIIYSKKNTLAFKLARENIGIQTISIAYGSIKADLVATSGGLYITGHSSAAKLTKSELDINAIHEIMLSEEDGRIFSQVMSMNDMRTKICMNRIAFLRGLIWRPGVFDFLPDHDESITIVYSKNGLIVVPVCVPVDGIEFLKNNNFCTVDIPVRFSVKTNIYRGYMQSNGIIKSASAKVPCPIEKFVPLNDTRVARFNGTETTILTVTDMRSVTDLLEVDWDVINFPHLSDIFSEKHVIEEYYRPTILSEKI